MNANPPSISSSRWGARTKRLVVIVLLVCAGFIILNLLNLIPLLVGAALLAYLLWPIVNFFQDWVLRPLPFRARTLSVVLTLITVLAVFVLVVVLVLPGLIDQIVEIADAVPDLLENLESDLERALSEPLVIGGQPVMVDGEPLIPLERLEEWTGGRTLGEIISSGDVDMLGTLGNFFGSIGGITGPAFSVVGAFFGFLVNMAFMTVIMFYFMRDGDRFAEILVNVTPVAYRGDVRRMLYELGRVWNAYFRGQLILCTLVGFAVYFAALALGLPRAEILGLLAGILEFIPNFGPFLALVPAFFMALVSESTTLPFLSGVPYALIVAAVWTLIQNLEAIYLVPRVMGGSLNLHPVVVIIGVLAGASVAGAVGIILAAPSMATLRLFGQYIYGKLFDLDPFPQPEPRPPRLYVRVPGRVLNGVRERSRYLVRYASGVSRSAHPQPDETLPS